MGLMSRAQSMLNRCLEATHGEEITYTRVDGVTTFTGIAWPGSEYSQPGTLGQVQQVRLNTNERPYLIPASLLEDDLPPAKGDRITVTLNGTSCVFEVMPTDINKAWTYSGTDRTRYRVQTKRVA